jgi:hypothetical protein
MMRKAKVYDDWFLPLIRDPKERELAWYLPGMLDWLNFGRATPNCFGIQKSGIANASTSHLQGS